MGSKFKGKIIDLYKCLDKLALLGYPCMLLASVRECNLSNKCMLSYLIFFFTLSRKPKCVYFVVIRSGVLRFYFFLKDDINIKCLFLTSCFWFYRRQPWEWERLVKQKRRQLVVMTTNCYRGRYANWPYPPQPNVIHPLKYSHLLVQMSLMSLIFSWIFFLFEI